MKATNKPPVRHLVNLQDYDEWEIYDLINLALRLKEEQKKGIPHPILSNKALGMIFSKASTRTRVSFEVGIYQLGGYGLFLNSSDIQLGRGETIEDTAKVLSRYLDGIMIRTYAQEDVEELARYSTIPVINGLTDMFHPCQILADLMTIYETKGQLKGLKLAYVGDGNNVAHSLLIGCTKVGMNISIACPTGYEPHKNVIDWAIGNSKSSGSLVNITSQPKEAVWDADIVYTDVWTSMGQEKESNERLKAFAPYQVNQSLFSLAKPDAIFLHCLPAHRGEEVTSEVIDGPQSLVFEEAENRLHVQKAVMVSLMGKQ
ncbi:MAG TPA: ornithine carbamoyltransferase [Clostridiales bacterium]|jgi:ornithine carbamoyltransferase|nr:ornithine carbamoyltransferase [Clostridiales bacterium]